MWLLIGKRQTECLWRWGWYFWYGW